MSSRWLLVLLFALALLGCASRATLPVPEHAASRGPRDAKVVVQEAGDFECPFCAQEQPVVRALMKEYAGRVRFVWRDYPLPRHASAPLAAEAAREVLAQKGDDAFWRYADVLFASRGALAREDLERYAEELGGVDMDRFRRALDGHVHARAVKEDELAVERAAGPVGAPTFFVGGEVLEGAQPIEVLRDAIERALGR